MPDSIYTDESLIADDIFTKVPDRLAQPLFYQCLFDIELFAKASGWLREAKEKLDYHNFARSQSCHMTEGLFGVNKHTSEMETAKVRPIGYLATTIGSGHKFLRSLKSARDRDGDLTWRATKKQLIRLQKSYGLARNACEHLDQGIRTGHIVELRDFSFSIHNVLTFKDRQSVVRTFDFSPEALEQVAELWKNTLSILRTRERNKGERSGGTPRKARGAPHFEQ